jgi:hypothetical protein
LAPIANAPNSSDIFCDQVNKERDGKKYKKLTPRYIAVTLTHIKNLSDLYYFKSQLDGYRQRGNSFSRGIFGALKPRQTDV